MIIRKRAAQGLKALIERDTAAGLPAAALPRIRDILAFVHAMATEDELRSATSWTVHLLAGERAGTWALHVKSQLADHVHHRLGGDRIVDLDHED